MFDNSFLHEIPVHVIVCIFNEGDLGSAISLLSHSCLKERTIKNIDLYIDLMGTEGCLD